jgi:hypothetical protein
VLKAWRAAEGRRLAEVGFRRKDTDRYMIALDGEDEWSGSVTLSKHIAVRGASRIDLGRTIGVALTHKPTEKLIRTLKGDKELEYVTLPGYSWELLPQDLNARLQQGYWIARSTTISCRGCGRTPTWKRWRVASKSRPKCGI